MRKALLAAVRPLVDRFANQLTELAHERAQAELARIEQTLEVALSAFASEVPGDDTDRRDHDPVPRVRRSPERGLHGDEPRRGEKPEDVAGPASRPAQETNRGREEGQRAARLVDPLEQVLGPVLSGMMAPAPKPQRFAKDGRKITQPTCKACGFVGGNKRRCGTAHVTIRFAEPTPARKTLAKADPAAAPMTAITAPRRLTATPGAIAAAKARIARIQTRAAIARAESATKPAVEPEVDDNPTSDERWSSQRISEERELAESRKPDIYEMPRPRSSFLVTPTSRGNDVARIDELDVGGDD